MKKEKKQPPSEAVNLLRQAKAEAAAAIAILLDRRCWPVCAALHLRRGWEALLATRRQSGAVEPVSLADQLRGLELPPLSSIQKDRLIEILEALEQAHQAVGHELPGKQLSASELKYHTKLLAVAAAHQLRKMGVASARWKWPVVGMVSGAVILIFLWAGGNRLQVEGEVRNHGWLGRYFPNAGFQGTPVIRYDEEINFDWLNRPPLKSVSADNFTVRWDSCLLTAEGENLRFEIGSDDGSRVYIDGRMVINMWRDQAGNWMSYDAKLPGGIHHLRVEYYEKGGSALVVLRMLGADRPISLRRLMVPQFRDSKVSCTGR